MVNGEKIKARKKTNNKWFETQDSISYWDDFNKPKIVWASVGATQYSYVPEGYFLLDTNYFMTSSVPLDLLAFLNSSLIVWWINSEDTQLGNGGAWRHYKYNLEKLCIPRNYKSLDKYVKKILDTKGSIDKESVEKINKTVYELYGLSQEEIDFVEQK